MSKACSKCKQEKPLEAFSRHPNGKFGRQSKCKDCLRPEKKAYSDRTKEARKVYDTAYYQANKQKWVERDKRMKDRDREGFLQRSREAGARWRSNPENLKKVHLRYIKSRYGITVEEYSKMYDDQKGLCAICGKDNGDIRLHVDHCHTTGKVRGLLCFLCNSALGKVKDDVAVLEKAILYLQKHQSLYRSWDPAFAGNP